MYEIFFPLLVAGAAIVSLVNGKYDFQHIYYPQLPFNSRGFPFLPHVPSLPLFQTSLPGAVPGFNFHAVSNDIQRQINSMRKKQSTLQMMKGTGGVTVIVGSDRILLKSDGTTYECDGNVVPHAPFCQGSLKRFRIRKWSDFCYSDRYSKIGNVLCVVRDDQASVIFSNTNGRYSCVDGNRNPGFIVSVAEYQRMCKKLPGEGLYHYYPDFSKPLHVPLPDPILSCEEQNKHVCVFRSRPYHTIL